MAPAKHPSTATASANITRRIHELGDWRGKTLAHLRTLIHDADSKIEEEWKWGDVPVWSHDGIVCTGESSKDKVKLTFARGARFPIRRSCSIPAWTAAPGGRSISLRGTRSRTLRSRR